MPELRGIAYVVRYAVSDLWHLIRGRDSMQAQALYRVMRPQDWTGLAPVLPDTVYAQCSAALLS